MTQPRLLIVEDDQDWETIYRRILQGEDYEIHAARKVSNALTLIEEQHFDVVITDLKMLGHAGEFSGFGVLEQAHRIDPAIQVIVITGYGSSDHALRAMSSGAYDYITKGKDLRQKLALSVQGALEIRQLRQEALTAPEQHDLNLQFDRIIGNSASMQALFEQINLAAHSQVNILLRGEGGTGKSLIAQTIHRQSPYKDGPFLVVDCGRLSETVLESELFGYQAGTFYQTAEEQPGKFERANGGTLFLDNIGDLELRLQTRLLGAICDRVVERVGGQTLIPLNIQLIASTDKNLETMLNKGQFHRRLFDALNEYVINVPPLRQRKDGDDIPALAAMFLQRYSQERTLRFAPETVELLHQYDYPGNVRELESAVKYALTVTDSPVITPQHLRPEIRQYAPPASPKQHQPDAKAEPVKTVLQVCPLNLSECSKKEEILRLYTAQRVFVNIPNQPEYAGLETLIRQTLEAYQLVPVFPKDYLEPIAMICTICKLIQTCKYSITELSSADTTVLYRLGQMHALGLHCALFKATQVGLATELQGLFLLEYGSRANFSGLLSRWIESQVKEAQPITPTINIPPPSRSAATAQTITMPTSALPSRQHNHTQLQVRLSQQVTLEELYRFCYDSPAAGGIYKQLKHGMDKASVIRLLLAHLNQPAHQAALLAWANNIASQNN